MISVLQSIFMGAVLLLSILVVLTLCVLAVVAIYAVVQAARGKLPAQREAAEAARELQRTVAEIEAAKREQEAYESRVRANTTRSVGMIDVPDDPPVDPRDLN